MTNNFKHLIPVILICTSCGKGDQPSTVTVDHQENAPAPYDTTAIDSLTPGATLAFQEKVAKTNADLEADSIKLAQQQEAIKKKEAQELAAKKEGETEDKEK